MKQNIKRITKKLGWYTLAIVAVATGAIVGWEQVRTPVVDWYAGDEVTVERPRAESSEFDLYRQTQTAIEENRLSFDRMKLEQEQAALEAQEAELEKKKEELRARELESSSLR